MAMFEVDAESGFSTSEMKMPVGMVDEVKWPNFGGPTRKYTTATPTGNTTIPSLLTLRFQTQKNVLFITIPSSKGTYLTLK